MEHSGSLSAMARRRVVLCILAIVIAQIVARPALGQAAQWSNLATVSNSTSLQAGSLCATDGRDIYCNSSVATLSGLAQADRITSGTAGVFVSNTGVITFRTGGVTTSYFDASGLLVAPGISATASGISTTNLTVRGTIDILSGTSNVLVGQFAGASGAGSNNTAVGMYASRNNSGSYVLSFGYAAARYNTGTQVLALGYSAAERNTNWYITAVGGSAAQDNTGRTVTAVGYSTAASNTGNRLTAVGANAAQNNTGSYTTALGLFAAQNNTYDNVTALGYNAQSDKANQVILGNANVVEVTTTGVILAAGVSTTGTVSATDIRLSTLATPPAAKCASAADEGRTIMTADGPYVCLMR